ncbi:transporter substrate-binding domain-containing protein [Caballeronia sp. 15715]|uniref:transporter substrate-binding domain-containing protein n=1 Tax=Caballeronia sp. 15715 TaxID=3391030 RepID=UPI0039E65FF6
MMNMRVKAAALAVALTLVSISPSYAAGKDTVPANELIVPGKLFVCADVPVPPYILFTDSGDYDGIDVALTSEIARRLGLKSQIVNTVFDTIIASAKGGKCDIIAGAMNITSEREKVITQIPYAQDGLSYAVRKGNPKSIKTKTDLCGARLATQTSTTGTNIIEGSGDFQGKGLYQLCKAAGKPDPVMQQYNKAPDVLMSVASGQSDASLIDTSITSVFVHEHPTMLESSAIGGLEPSPQGLGVTFDHPGLANAVRKVLADIVEDGTYDRIFKKYNYVEGSLLTKK